jgi:hypothetical protein
LFDAIDLVESELASAEDSLRLGKAPKPGELLLGKTPLRYMVHVLRQIASNDLEQALLVLPFHYVKRFISILLKVKTYYTIHAVSV